MDWPVHVYDLYNCVNFFNISDYKLVCIHDQSIFFNAHYDKTFVFREH